MNKYLQPLEQFNPLFFNNGLGIFYISTLFLSLYLIFLTTNFFMTASSVYLMEENKNFNKIILTFLLNFFLLEIFKAQVTKKGQKYFIIFFSLFIFLLMANLLGLLLWGFTVTSHLTIALFFSITFFIGIIVIGFWIHGLSFYKILVPSGAPKALLPFLIFIEFISYVSRVFSLAIRLFANMMAGHTLLHIIATFSIFLWFYLSFFLFLLPTFVIFILFFLELAIAFLQAYVFVVLVSIYLNDSILLSH